jgi:hypothetical protein
MNLKSLAKRLVSLGEDDEEKAKEKAEATVPVQARVGMKVIRASGEVEDLGVIHDEKAFVPREDGGRLESPGSGGEVDGNCDYERGRGMDGGQDQRSRLHQA